MNSTITGRLQEAIGETRVHSEGDLLRERRFDHWVFSHLREWRGDAVEAPGLVVQPESPSEVQAVVRIARDERVPIVPYGLGSGVCGGIRPDPSVILVDLGRMSRVRGIDETNLLVELDAGVVGIEAEEAVAAKELTIGHWPQSIEISTVGGWVSTRAAGQLSTAYGNIEDIVHSIEAVLPNGELVRLGKAPRAAAGPDLRHLLLGAEGTLGIVTGVTLALRRQPERRAFTAFHTPSLGVGFAVQREIVQSEWLPPVMRQYDLPEVQRGFGDYVSGESGLLLMIHEGPAARVAAEVEAVREIAGRAGLPAAPEEICAHWLEHRNEVPEWRDLLEKHLIADTIEISAPWTRIEAIYRDAIESLRQQAGVLVASAHSSHVYRSGLNLYFTFAARHEDPAEMEAIYFECWRRVMEATARNGGGIAHHHGAGRLRKPYLHHDLGAGGVELLRTLKAAIDPAGIMNPGNLIPDAVECAR